MPYATVIEITRSRRHAASHTSVCGQRSTPWWKAHLDAALVLVILILLVVGATVTGIPHKLDNPELVTIAVQKGDTLWGLAEKYPAPGLDTKETAELLTRVNSLEKKTLLAGAIVQVPANSTENRLTLMP